MVVCTGSAATPWYRLVDIGHVCAPPDLPTAPYFTLLFFKPERITLKTQKRKVGDSTSDTTHCPCADLSCPT